MMIITDTLLIPHNLTDITQSTLNCITGNTTGNVLEISASDPWRPCCSLHVV